ncbi:MAG: hypothetical protein AB8G15_11265, partial [Saprospiraceae bacterium]
MKNFKKIILLTFFLLSFTVNIWGQPEATTTKNKNITADLLLACGDHFQLTDEVSMYNDISVVGDYVAWGNIFGDIKLYKISTDEIISIYTGTDFDFNSWVQLDETYLYFNTETGGFRKYHLLDETITYLYGDSFNGAMIAGNNMASVESVGGLNLEVFYKDLTGTGDAVNISNNPDSDRFFFVGENAIAWTSSNNAVEQLMVYVPADGTNQGEVVVTTPNTSALDIYRPIIVGNQVYFSKKNGDFYQLWSYDIQTAATPVLLLDLSSNHHVNAAYGDYLVLRNSEQVKLYKISDGTVVDLPNSNNNGATRINGQYVFWENETVATGNDIFRYDITLQQSTVFASTLVQDFIITISEDYAVYAQG